MADSNVQQMYYPMPQFPAGPPWWGGSWAPPPWWPPAPQPGPTFPGPPPATRGLVGALSPSSYPEVPLPPGPVVQPTQPSSQPVSGLSGIERETLKRALVLLKEGRTSTTSGTLSALESQRLLAAFAYLSGFLEARGFVQLGAFLSTVPVNPTASASELDAFVAQVESLVGGGDTRMAPAAIAGWILIGAAGNAVWEGAKWAYGKLST